MTTLYGIPNCDTIKKARRWLAEHKIDYEFHDYKKQGIDEILLRQWCQSKGWENVLNKRGTTWRKLADADKKNINETQAIKLLIQNTSMIKRPILQGKQGLLIGFNAETYKQFFSK